MNKMHKIKSGARFKRNRLVIGVASAIALSLSSNAMADSAEIDLDIKGQKIGPVMMELGQRAGVQIIVPQDIGNSLELSGIDGEYTLVQALEELLAGTGLAYTFTAEDVVVIDNAGESKVESASEDEPVEEIVILGSHIKTNPGELDRQIQTLDREDILASGATTFAEFMQRLPQNFNAATEVAATLGNNTFGSTQNLFAAAGVNLRGIGDSNTLVLLNGKRMARGGVLGEANDISGIPLSMIERVEILYDGASALYGADAVGGVVNIVTRKDYEGVEVGLEYEFPEDGGTAQTKLTLAGGFSWDTGSLTASYEYMTRSALTGDERPLEFVDENARNIFPGVAGSPNIFVSEFSSVPLFYVDASNNIISLEDDVFGGADPTDFFGQQTIASTAASLGLTPVTNSQIPAGVDPEDIDASDMTLAAVPSGVRNEDGRSLLPAREQHSINLELTQELTSSVNLNASVFYSNDQTDSSTNNQAFEVNVFRGLTEGEPEVETDFADPNPLNPLPVAYTLNVLIPYLPDQQQNTSKEDWSYSVGVDGDFGDMFESWSWDLSYSASKGENESFQENSVNGIALRALGEGRNNIFTGFGTFEPDPRLYQLNPYDPLLGLDSEQDVMEVFLNPAYTTTQESEDSTLEFSTIGTLFSLTGGDVRARFAGGVRAEELLIGNATPQPIISSAVAETAGEQVDGLFRYDEEADRENTYGSVEVNVPLIGGANSLPGVQSFDITLSGRYDSFTSNGESGGLENIALVEQCSISFLPVDACFDPFGNPLPLVSTVTADVTDPAPFSEDHSGVSWSAGFTWRANDWLLLRGNRATSFAAPALATLAFPQIFTPANPEVFVSNPPEFVGFMPLPTINITGGNADLQAEDSVTTSIGFELTPPSLEDFSLRVNFHRSETEGKIAAASSLLPAATNLAADPVLYTQSNPFISYDPDTGLFVSDSRPQNLGLVNTQGVDIDANYSWDTEVGSFDVSLGYSYMDEYEVTKFDLPLEVLCPELDESCVQFAELDVNPQDLVEHVALNVDQAPVPEHRGNMSLRWNYKGLFVSLDQLYTSNTSFETRVQDPSYVPGLDDPTGLPGQRPVVTTSKPSNPLNLVMQYDFDGDLFNAPGWLSGTRMGLSIPNILDDQFETTSTPVVEGDLGNVLNPTYYSPKGRTITLSLSKTF